MFEWSSGPLVHLSSGPLVHLSPGPLVPLSPCPLVQLSPGPLVLCVITFVLLVIGRFYFSLLRAKYHKLKYGTELNQGEIKPPSYDSGESHV